MHFYMNLQLEEIITYTVTEKKTAFFDFKYFLF